MTASAEGATVATNDPAPNPAARRPSRWLGLAFWAVAVAFLAWLWPRSGAAADVVCVYSRSATVHGVLSHRGHLMLFTTSIALNPELALTADRLAAPADEADPWFHAAYTDAGVRRQWFAFGYAEGRRGDLAELPAASWAVAVVPHWAVLAACSAAFGWHAWRYGLRARERRWARHGRCAACGYDLRGIASGRCPECGAGTGFSPALARRMTKSE